jgi:probable F420-dependent oxidoreductase
VRTPLRISITVSGLSALFGRDLSGVVAAAHLADAVGIDQIAVPDHLAIGPGTDRYPYGRFPLPREEPWLEPLTTLATIAGATRRIRLATGVLIAPLRPALLLAKSAATLDVLSGGRVDLGVGVGWQREELEAGGVPFEERWRRLDDTLRACRTLWRDAPASFRSETVSFDDVVCLPRPARDGGIPVWLGLAASETNLPRIVELGDGWMPMTAEPEALARDVGRIRSALAAAGRDPARFGVRVSVPGVTDDTGRVDLERTLTTLPALAEAGATHAAFALGRFVREPESLRPFLERLGKLTQTGR